MALVYRGQVTLHNVLPALPAHNHILYCEGSSLWLRIKRRLLNPLWELF